MKKLLTGLLAMLTCFACATAVACGDDNKDNSSSTPINTESSDTGSSDTGSSDTGSSDEEDDLQDAADYLDSLYKDEHKETRTNYEVLPAIWGYNITWSVTLPEGVTEGVEIVVANDKVTVKVTPAEEDINYVLTATVTDGTKTASVSFNRKVLAVRNVPYEVITEAPVENTAYKYVLYQSNLNADLYFAGSMSGFYYQSTSSPVDAVDLYAEYVEGSTTEFMLYFNNKSNKKQYIGVEEGWNSKNLHWTFNVVIKDTAPSVFVWDEELSMIITTVPCRSAEDNTNQEAAQTTTETLYIGTYNEYKTFSASTLDKAADSFVAYLATFDINKLSDQDKANLDASELKISTSFSVDASIDLPSAGKLDGVTVTWAVAQNDYVTVANGKLNVTIPETATTVKLTATVTCGEATATKEFELSLVPATKMTIPEALAAADGTTIAVSGTVDQINTPWDEGYGNMTVTIKDANGNSLYVFRLSTKVELGDIITVTGVMATYNDNRQIGQGGVAVITGHDTSYDQTVQPTLYAVVPEVGTPYVFGMTQANCENKVYYLAGGMDGFYMATIDDANKAIKTYLEATTGGYYFYTYVGETKTYINMVVNGEHVNGAYEATASTVYTIDEENKTLIAAVNGEDYWFGTRNDKTYTTMGPCKVSYNGFYGVFYTDEEPTPVTTYTLTLVNGTETTSKLAEGAALQLPALEAEGKTFLGWFDGEGNAAPATMPAAALTLTAKWEVNVYTLTIKQEGEEDKAFTFGVEKVENRTAYLPSELKGILEANLPANFKWAEAVPETFELKNYIFTIISAEVPKFTLTLVNGTETTSELAEGAALQLPALEAEGKTFLGWFDGEGNAAPATMPAAALTLTAKWEVNVYTLTIKQEGEEDKAFTFGVEKVENRTAHLPTDLKGILEANLPKDETGKFTYAWTETIPDTFALQNYTFTVKATQVIYTIPEANAAADNTAVVVSGTVSQVNGAWSDSYGNMNVTIKDADGNELYVYRLATKVALGDIVTIQGKVGSHEGAKQIAAGATATITDHDNSYDYEEMTILEAIAANDGANVIVTGTVVKIGTAYSSQYNNISVYIADDDGNQLYLYRLTGDVALNKIIKVKGSMATYSGSRQVAGGTFEEVGTHTCSKYTEATCAKPASCVVCGTAKDNVLSNQHNYVEHVCSVCNAVEPGYEGNVATPTTVSVTLANLGWSDKTQYTSLEMDEVITVTAKGGSNTGKYYTSGANWRMYYSENATVVVSAESGYTIKSVKITYVIESGGVLTYGEAQIASGTVVDVNAASITFGVDDTVRTDGDNGKNKAGQVRITAIEVVYVANS